MDGHSEWIRAVVFSPRGDQLASVSDDKTVRLWNVNTGKCLSTLTGHDEAIECISYSTSGDLLASGGLERTVRIWEIESGQCVSVISNLTSAVRAVSWVDGSEANLVTGLQNGSLLAWRVDTDREQSEVLEWGVTSGSLDVTGASIQDVQNLSQSNQQLLKQRGAVGEPYQLLREAGKKIVSMASVVSKLKATSNEMAKDPTITVKQLEQRVQEVQDPQLRDILKVFVAGLAPLDKK
jgi:WD40 repeat protein